ncbi:MAG: hypothetical protein KGJ80_06950 [Chloroflexota bacterium]|nr:hypothetical protein [Chloroflexota bacterium]
MPGEEGAATDGDGAGEGEGLGDTRRGIDGYGLPQYGQFRLPDAILRPQFGQAGYRRKMKKSDAMRTMARLKTHRIPNREDEAEGELTTLFLHHARNDLVALERSVAPSIEIRFG